VFDQGAGYRQSPLRSDLRGLLSDRIVELGKKRWPCFKKPTIQQQIEVLSSIKLQTLQMNSYIALGRHNGMGGMLHGVVDAFGGSRGASAPASAVGTDGLASGTAAASNGAAVDEDPHKHHRGAASQASCASSSLAGGNETTACVEPLNAEGATKMHGESMCDASSVIGRGGSAIDSDILDALGENGHDSDHPEVLEIERMFLSYVSVFNVVPDPQIETEQRRKQLETHYASCFKYPELVSFVVLHKFQIGLRVPHTYANKVAIRRIGKDVTKEYWQPLTQDRMMRATAHITKCHEANPEPWRVHLAPNLSFISYEEDGTECIRMNDCWSPCEIFNDDQVVYAFSPAGKNELLRQPGQPPDSCVRDETEAEATLADTDAGASAEST
jgi:hypothetical protein